MQLSSLGFPRIGRLRELKFAVEKYWRGESSKADLLDIAKGLREKTGIGKLMLESH